MTLLHFKYKFTMTGALPMLLFVAQIVMLVLLLLHIVPFWAGVLPIMVIGSLWMILLDFIILTGGN